MKNRPLFGLSFTILIAIVIISILPLTIFNTKGFKNFSYNETELYLRENCLMLKNLFAEDRASDEIEQLKSFADKAAESTSLRITIIRGDGLVLADSHNASAAMNNHADRPEIRTALLEGYGSSVRNSATMAFEMMYTAVKIGFADGEFGTIRLARSLEDIDANIKLITRNTFLICVILLAVAAWISFIIAGRVSLLIHKIKISSKQYASGNFNEQLFISRPAEISDLADDLNLMGVQLKERIETIEAQKNELQLILDSMTEPVLFTDRDLKILRLNGAAEKLFGINEKQQQGKSILEIFMNSQLNDFAENLLETGVSRVEVITLDLPKTIHLEIHGTVVFEQDGETVAALLLVMHDITKAIKLEQMRKDFVANVSHELKTPVTMIKGYIETLLDNPHGSPDKTVEFLEIIEKHSLRVEAIINDLLFLSGIEKNDVDNLTIESIPAVDLITSAVTSCEAFAEEKDISIKIDCDENIIMNVYPLLAEQAVINLIDNALKYSESGTTVEIKVRKAENGKTLLSVKDQGCGISIDQQTRIFERFYRVDKARSRDSGGTGLGLSIVRHIALAHNGSIEVKSVPGSGAEFIICI